MKYDPIELNQALELVDDRRRRILTARFIEGKTRVEIAKEFNLSPPRIRMLEMDALAKIKAKIEHDDLFDSFR